VGCQLQKALAGLSAVERALLLLRHRDRLSATEIAAELGLTDEEIEAQLLHAVEKLSSQLRKGSDETKH
jgi:RNA polymerase sigma factor (sigma-70 family)